MQASVAEVRDNRATKRDRFYGGEGPNNSPMYPTALTHRHTSYAAESDGVGNGGGIFGGRGVPNPSAYGSNGSGAEYYQQLQAHAANTRQILADGAFNAAAVAAAYSQGGGGGGGGWGITCTHSRTRQSVCPYLRVTCFAALSPFPHPSSSLAATPNAVYIRSLVRTHIDGLVNGDPCVQPTPFSKCALALRHGEWVGGWPWDRGGVEWSWKRKEAGNDKSFMHAPPQQ
ncbi:hypothetical protein Aperf_G00000026935 [Anoplocephala perfoliata]